MSRSFRHNKYDEQLSDDTTSDRSSWDRDTLLDDAQLSTDESNPMSANSSATGNLSVSKSLSSKARKRADKQFRKQRRHDERL